MINYVIKCFLNKEDSQEKNEDKFYREGKDDEID